jgi:malate synthase
MDAELKAFVARIIRRIAEENQRLAQGDADAQETLDALHLDLFLEAGINVSEHPDETLNDWASDWFA